MTPARNGLVKTLVGVARHKSPSFTLIIDPATEDEIRNLFIRWTPLWPAMQKYFCVDEWAMQKAVNDYESSLCSLDQLMVREENVKDTKVINGILVANAHAFYRRLKMYNTDTNRAHVRFFYSIYNLVYPNTYIPRSKEITAAHFLDSLPKGQRAAMAGDFISLKVANYFTKLPMDEEMVLSRLMALQTIETTMVPSDLAVRRLLKFFNEEGLITDTYDKEDVERYLNIE